MRQQFRLGPIDVHPPDSGLPVAIRDEHDRAVVWRHRRPRVGALACQRLAAAAGAVDDGQLRVATLTRAHDEASVLEWRDAEQSVVAF